MGVGIDDVSLGEPSCRTLHITVCCERKNENRRDVAVRALHIVGTDLYRYREGPNSRCETSHRLYSGIDRVGVQLTAGRSYGGTAPRRISVKSYRLYDFTTIGYGMCDKNSQVRRGPP